MTTSGISFERAAGFYDATRALPDDVVTALSDILTAELRVRQPCLEIGVGTGRIALPLAARGVRLMGTDLAPAMLRRLVANAGGREPFPIVLADVSTLPLVASSVRAVLASHVLHLIAEWRRVVDEAVRVLVPGGTLLVDFGGGVPAPWSTAARGCFERHGVHRIRPGANAPADVVAHLGDRAALRPLPAVDMSVRRSLADDLDQWEHQIHSWTWPYSAGQLEAACADIRRWADDQSWPVEQVVDLARSVRWWAFDLAGS